MKRPQEACDLLEPAASQFPHIWTIPCNLAGYCGQLGRLAECQNWFQQAMPFDQGSVQLAALNEADL